jgi:hypothetical protein
MGAFLFLFVAIMLTLYTREIFRDVKEDVPPEYKTPLKFEEGACGPWSYFADQIAPRQRKTF